MNSVNLEKRRISNSHSSHRESVGEVSRPIYAAASPLRVPFPIDFSCEISKVFLI